MNNDFEIHISEPHDEPAEPIEIKLIEAEPVRVLEAKDPITGLSYEVSVQKIAEEMSMGNRINKGKVNVWTDSDLDDEVLKMQVMIAKYFSDAESAAEYADYWLKLLYAGIPTIPKVLIIGEKEVLLTDMTSDGSVFYGKDNVNPSFQRYEKNKMTELDAVFLSIDPEEIKAKAEEIIKKANANGIFLPSDDPFDILIHPDGSWEVIVLDLLSKPFSEVLEGNNSFCVDKIMSFVSHMRNALTGRGEKPFIVLGKTVVIDP